MKAEEVLHLAAKYELNADEVYPLKDEASGRRYWRLKNNSYSFVLCYLDPNKGDHKNFIKISNDLTANNVSAPKIIHHDKISGILIQEDLGDGDLLKILDQNNKTNLLKKSLDVLIKIQQSKISELTKLSTNELINQMYLFKSKFCNEFLNIDTDESIDDLIDIAINGIKSQPWTNCHFDFERRNLILVDSNNISVIDYQDMKIGPIGIDLSGILIDHYYPFDEIEVKKLLDYYSDKSNISDEVDLFDALKWGSVQRNMRILGTLSDLYTSKNRAFRLKDLPMILHNLIAILGDEKSKYDFLDESSKMLEIKLKSL